jgi:hypothetical protein
VGRQLAAAAPASQVVTHITFSITSCSNSCSGLQGVSIDSCWGSPGGQLGCLLLLWRQPCHWLVGCYTLQDCSHAVPCLKVPCAAFEPYMQATCTTSLVCYFFNRTGDRGGFNNLSKTWCILYSDYESILRQFKDRSNKERDTRVAREFASLKDKLACRGRAQTKNKKPVVELHRT